MAEPSTWLATNQTRLLNQSGTFTAASQIICQPTDISSCIGPALLWMSAAPNGTLASNCTLTAKLQTAPEAEMITSKVITGTGNGRLGAYAGPACVSEVITLTMTAADTFTAAGSVSGAFPGRKYTDGSFSLSLPTGGVLTGILYTGSVAFVSGDTIAITTTARTWTDYAPLGTVSFPRTTAYQRKAVIKTDSMPRYVRLAYTMAGTTPSFHVDASVMFTGQSYIAPTSGAPIYL